MPLLVGPPASGKTTRLLEIAQEFLRARKRVWWVTLPAQRGYVYRRATQAMGAVLGLEVLSSQQLYYRILAASFGLRPILTGPGRVALVGEALADPSAPIPSPGEARLFARAIAEAKRHGVGPGEIPPTSREARRLAQVYARYEELKTAWGRWDYDDFRSAALELLESKQARLEAELLIVDGFRELNPLELRVFQAIGQQIPAWLSLPEAPGNLVPQATLPARALSVQVYRAPNPVSEARWILRSIKRDLAGGLEPLELALIAPPGRIPALLILADEYGVPLADQTASTAAETPEGRLLLELLELPDYPTPSRLLAIPDLAPLGRAALERGLVGRPAVGRLAAELGMEEVWAAWLERLEPQANPLRWAQELLDSLPEVRNSPRRAALMERAREAHRIASGPQFRQWWSALLSETYEPRHPPGGVALLTPLLASGQRWKKVYLHYAVEGAYTTGEREDYFVPEELRVAPEPSVRAALPRRFLGRDRRLLAELRSRAETVVITYPEANQDGPLEPEPGLVTQASALPKLPPASPLETAAAEAYRASLGRANLGPLTLEALRRYEECSLRLWAGRFLARPQPSGWSLLLHELRRAEKLVPARLEALAKQFPQAEGWLRHHQERLGGLSLGFRLEGTRRPPTSPRQPQPRPVEQSPSHPPQTQPVAFLDGVSRTGSEAHIYRFAEPGAGEEAREAVRRRRWSERWAAAYLLSAFPGRITRVQLWVWPILEEPIPVYERPIEGVWGRFGELLEQVQAAIPPFERGIIQPKPGFHCRDCPVRDICREGGSN
ncbi:MAG: ATP-dependent nuclease subunit B [Thermaceae bacterium]|nr:ATP-dependent nuclease subunit B [Thermaceae bacterium]